MLGIPVIKRGFWHLPRHASHAGKPYLAEPNPHAFLLDCQMNYC